MLISLGRTVILYFAVIFAIRLMGKRQIGELQPSELVITILVSELATLPMQDFDIPVIFCLIPIVTLVFFEHIVSILCIKSSRLRRIVNGNPCIVVRDGKIDVKTLKNLRITVDELLEELRTSNITEISDVKYALVETNGKLSYVLKPYAQNVTAGMLNVNVKDSSLPLIIVNDGSIITKNLYELKKDVKWLYKYLKENGNVNILDIFVMTLDSSNNVFIQKRSV